MQIDKQDLLNIIKETVKTTILELGIGKQPVKIPSKQERSAYQKTEMLLWNYRGFQRVIKEKQDQIDEIKKYGVPHKGNAVHSYGGSNTVSGITTSQESVDAAVHNIESSIAETINALELIDSSMATLRNDPYYKLLEMHYFEGRTQEDIAIYYNCTQSTIAKNKSRLVRELSVRLFPNEVAKEMLQ